MKKSGVAPSFETKKVVVGGDAAEAKLMDVQDLQLEEQEQLPNPRLHGSMRVKTNCSIDSDLLSSSSEDSSNVYDGSSCSSSDSGFSVMGEMWMTRTLL